MAGILVFSPKCNHCLQIIDYIQKNATLQTLVQYHNINTQGVPDPDKVKRVPTMITKNGKFLVGNEIKAWLNSLLPQEITNCDLGGSCGACSLDNPEEDDGTLFTLDSYGQSLQPILTKELQDKINRNVSDAFSSNQQ